MSEEPIDYGDYHRRLRQSSEGDPSLVVLGVMTLLCTCVWGLAKALFTIPYPLWGLVALSIGIPIGLLLLYNIGHEPPDRTLRKLADHGILTTATVVRSEPHHTHEDVGLKGVYTYQTQDGKRYQAEFKLEIHWPSNEQWAEVERRYGPAATNPLTYLPAQPGTHLYHTSALLGVGLRRAQLLPVPDSSDERGGSIGE